MKKMFRYVFLALFIFSKDAFSFIPPPGPISPVFDGINDVIESAKAIMKKLRTVADEAQRIRDEAMNAIKSAKQYINLDMTESPLKKEKGVSTIASAKDIVESKVADIKDETSVSDAYQKLFLEYPKDLIDKFPISQKEMILKMYNNKRLEFANDNMMELYVSIRDLEDNRLPALEKELKSLSDCFVKGQEGTSSICDSASAADEELGNWVNQYKLNALYDSYMRLQQELAALKAQYASGIALQKGVEPFNAEEILQEHEDDNVSYHTYFETTTSYAQQVKSSILQQNDEASKPVSSSSGPKRKVDNSGYQLKKPVEYNVHTPFEGAEEQMKALPIIEGAYDLLNEAKKMHNMKQQLPDLRKPFLEYEKMRALHDESIARLAQAETNSRDYFADYYGTTLADKLWFGEGCHLEKKKLGKKCPTVTGCKEAKDYADYYSYTILCPNDIYPITSYEKKDGMSGYAISAYRLSKADKILSMEGDVIGYVSDSGSARDLSGAKIGLTTPTGQVKDSQGNVIGSVLKSGVVLDPDELGTAVIDLNMSVSTSKLDKDKESDPKKMIGGEDVTNPSDEDYAEASVREQNLNRWQIGSSVSKLVGADMQGEQSFGKPSRKYPVWGDEKRFYKQYIDEKYKNMAIFLVSPRVELGIFNLAAKINSAMKVDQDTIDRYDRKLQAEVDSEVNSLYRWANSFEADDPERNSAWSYYYSESRRLQREKEDAVEKYKEELEEKLRKEQAANALSITASKQSWQNTVENFEKSSPLAKMLEAHHAANEALETSFKEEIKKLKKDKADLYDQIDDKMVKLNEKKKQYNDLMNVKKDAESDMEGQDVVINKYDERKAKDSTYVAGFKDAAIEKKEESKKTAKKAEQEGSSVLAGVDKLQDDIDKLRKRVEKIDKDIENATKNYIKNAVDQEHKQHEEIKNALESRISLMPPMNPGLLTGSTSTIGSIYNMSVALVNKFKANAALAIANAYFDLLGLGDDLYDPDKYSKISTIHKKMLSSMAGSGYSHARNVISGLLVDNSTVVSQAGSLLVGIVLGGTSEYEKEDSQYFIAMNPQQKDFYAPKRISPERTPPIREVFHFDTGDYDSILKTEAHLIVDPTTLIPRTKKPQTTRAEFLKIGQAVPPIWRTILEPNGFVERDVDVENIINAGDEKPKPAITLIGRILSTLMPTENETKAKAFLEAKGEKPVSQSTSELSVFLTYENGLTFGDPFYALVQYIEKAAEGKGNTDEKKLKEKEKEMLTRDQVGDYLQFVDLEQTYQVSVNQLKVKADEGRHTIEDALKDIYCTYKPKETGYIKEADVKTKIVSTEFIADQETFEAVAKCLDQGKNMFISEAKDLLKRLPSMNDFLQERYEKVDRLMKALDYDNEEFVQLSDSVDLATLDQDVKSKKADRAAVDTYGNEAQSEFEKNLDQFEVPYRAKYF